MTLHIEHILNNFNHFVSKTITYSRKMILQRLYYILSTILIKIWNKLRILILIVKYIRFWFTIGLKLRPAFKCKLRKGAVNRRLMFVVLIKMAQTQTRWTWLFLYRNWTGIICNFLFRQIRTKFCLSLINLCIMLFFHSDVGYIWYPI